MKEQSTLDKLKTIGEWIHTNKTAIKNDRLNVMFSVIQPSETGAYVFGTHCINEDNMLVLVFDTLKEFYLEHDEYDSFESYLNDVKDHFLELDTLDGHSQTIRYTDDDED